MLNTRNEKAAVLSNCGFRCSAMPDFIFTRYAGFGYAVAIFCCAKKMVVHNLLNLQRPCI